MAHHNPPLPGASARAPLLAITSGEPAGIGPELCAALAGAAGPVEVVARDENNLVTGVVKEIASLAPGETKKAVLAVKVTGNDIIQNPGFQVFVEGDYRVVFSPPKMYRFF